jgi:hypothetical protein
MPHVQIRDVPNDVHAELIRRAEAAGQSLQQYLSIQLTLLATTPSIDSILDRIEQRSRGALPASSAIRSLDSERAGR